jgi:hypothetical protein
MNKNEIPIKSNGAAEIAAPDRYGGDHIFASLISKLTLAASATDARPKLIQRKNLSIMMNEFALSPF